MIVSRSTSWLLTLPVAVILLVGGVGRRTGTGSVGAFLFGAGDEAEPQPQPATVEKIVPPTGRTARRILVFGGNGFLGAETVERLVRLGDNVTIVNRGNWYWDSKERIAPHVDAISCDRKNGAKSCDDLVQLINKVDKFDAVIDFSAYGRQEITDAVALLSGEGDRPAKTKIYVLISTDSVYDVCEPATRSPSGQVRETDAVRPSDPEVRRVLAEHHEYANGKFEAEEELVKQRKPSSSSDKPDAPKQDPTGIPYVILRLPDVLGPRDTTYRFWVYQLWIRVASKLPRRPVVVPEFLVGYNNSFVHVEDVARTVVDIVDRVSPGSDASAAAGESIVDEVYNLAWPQNITLDGLLRDIESALNKDDANFERLPFKTDGEANLYLYPTVRRGPIDSSKATAALGWRPTEWQTAIRSTVEFYEKAIKEPKWRTQRDEIIQVVSAQLYPGSWEEREEFFTVLENLYGIDLAHFRPKREEL